MEHECRKQFRWLSAATIAAYFAILYAARIWLDTIVHSSDRPPGNMYDHSEWVLALVVGFVAFFAAFNMSAERADTILSRIKPLGSVQSWFTEVRHHFFVVVRVLLALSISLLVYAGFSGRPLRGFIETIWQGADDVLHHFAFDAVLLAAFFVAIALYQVLIRMVSSLNDSDTGLQETRTFVAGFLVLACFVVFYLSQLIVLLERSHCSGNEYFNAAKDVGLYSLFAVLSLAGFRFVNWLKAGVTRESWDKALWSIVVVGTCALAVYIILAVADSIYFANQAPGSKILRDLPIGWQRRLVEQTASTRDIVYVPLGMVVAFVALILAFIRYRPPYVAVDPNLLSAKLAELLAATGFYHVAGNSYDGALRRVYFLKHVIENGDGYRLFYDSRGRPIKREEDLHVAFRLAWYGTSLEVNSVSRGSADATLVEFKLAGNSQLKQNLEKQVSVYERANQTEQSIKVIVCFSEFEEAKVRRILRELGLSNSKSVVLIDARKDDKPSASRAR